MEEFFYKWRKVLDLDKGNVSTSNVKNSPRQRATLDSGFNRVGLRNTKGIIVGECRQRISSTRRDKIGGPLCEPALGALYTLARGKVTSVRGFILTK